MTPKPSLSLRKYRIDYHYTICEHYHLLDLEAGTYEPCEVCGHVPSRKRYLFYVGREELPP
jgi:hypothetical protein